MPHAKIRTLMQLNTDQRLSKLSRKSLSRSRFHLVARTLLRVIFPHFIFSFLPFFPLSFGQDALYGRRHAAIVYPHFLPLALFSFFYAIFISSCPDWCAFGARRRTPSVSLALISYQL